MLKINIPNLFNDWGFFLTIKDENVHFDGFSSNKSHYFYILVIFATLLYYTFLYKQSYNITISNLFVDKY